MPPSVPRRLLELLAPERVRDEIVADLAEGFEARMNRDGVRAARRWYWRQVFSLDWWRLRRELAARASPRVEGRGHRKELMHSLFRDLRHALRSLKRSPGFTAVVVSTLALGIGANVALVSVIRSVLMRPLPYGDEERIVSLWSQWTGFPKTWVSIPEYRFYREEIESLEDVALYDSTSGNLTDQDDPERVGVAAVTPNLFEIFRVAPATGRTFTPAEAKPQVSEFVVLSHRLWARRYGVEPDLVGRRVELDGVPRTVIGILPESFQLPIDFNAETPTEVYLPLDVPQGMTPLPRMGGSHSYYAVARLRDGVDLERARSELLAANQRATEDGVYPEPWRFRTLLVPVAEDVMGDVRPALWILAGAVGFVLLIACANVANLVLSRGQKRRREVALRAALGAGRSRIFRQLMTESFVLAALGGGLALLLARSALSVLIALEPGSIPRLGHATLDGGALSFAGIVTLATAFFFGVLPAFSIARQAPGIGLREGSRGAGSGAATERFRAALVVVQISLAVVLVAGAGLMMRTFAHLLRIDPGFRSENVLTLRLSLPERSYPDDEDVVSFYERLLERVRAVPGVEEAGAVRVLPLATQIGDWGTRIEGYTPPPGENPSADWQVASPGYFEVMRIPLIEGRLFAATDRADAEQVALVNEAFADRFWPGESALGKRILIGGAEDPPWSRVVGVVGNVRHNGITAEIKEKWYRPHEQFHRSSDFAVRGMTLVIRASVPPGSLAAPVRSIVREMDSKLPLAEIRNLDEVLSQSMARARFTMALLLSFSGLALVLASVGVYGVVSYVVSQRASEFGIRMALGESPAGVVAMVMKRGLLMAVLGVAAGTLAAIFLSRFMASVLYGVGPRDPATFGGVALVLLLSALAGCAHPAVRASRIDPVEALRAE